MHYHGKDTAVMTIPKRFTVDSGISRFMHQTKGEQQEQLDRLHAEASEFFAYANSDRAETQEFQKASLRTFDAD
jgi:hypothetical protein